MPARPRRMRSATLVAVLVSLAMLLSRTPAQAAAHQQIQGSGSSWATNALNVWIAGVTSSGLQVVFTSTGSAQGRKDFGNSTTDFAVSDIGYQGRDPQTGDVDVPCKLGSTSNCRDYGYLPIVAGGTAFAYHLQINGSLVRNLRLSGSTLAKIFTAKIKNWNDPAITADNNGRKFPSIPIIPIVHSEGSGSTAQFTQYLDTEHPDIWRGYTGKAGETEYYPKGPSMIAQNGSDGVMNYIASAAANGAIGYDEYSYALGKNYPVAKIENAAGYFTLPTQFNVAVALQKAQINTNKSDPNYLLQKLDQVYVDSDKRTYPLSSYSYGIIPTAANDDRLNTAKRQTLADFLFYSVCQGQAQIGPVGYSALPLNLVQASFDQIAKLKAADPNFDLTSRNVTSCNNPTFVAGNLSANRLAQIAPQPPACDFKNAGPCDGAGDSGTSGIPHSSGTDGSSSPNANGAAAGTAGQPGSTTKALKPGTNPKAGASGANQGTTIDPETGEPVATDTQTAQAAPAATDLADYRQLNMSTLLGPLAVIEMLVVLIAPPLVYFYVIRPRARKRS